MHRNQPPLLAEWMSPSILACAFQSARCVNQLLA